MTDYTALKAYWATLPVAETGDVTAISSNLASINAHTIVGPRIDVPVGLVIGYLALSMKLVSLQGYASNPPAGANPQAVVVAKELLTLLSTPGLAVFRASDPATYSGIESMLGAIVADQANSGVTDADQASLLALANGPTLIWHSTPVAEGGAGLSGSYVNSWDLFNAGLISETDAHAVELARLP